MIFRNALKFRTRKSYLAAAAMSALMLSNMPAQGYEILGTGTESLIGGDLTDPEDDGLPESNIGYNALFDASDEASFGAGEAAFNVFDNILGPGNDKWCCGKANGMSEEDPSWVQAQLPQRHFLTSFTMSSANDVPERDPNFWAVQGSNDGVNFTDIYVYDDAVGPWDDRLQVVEFSTVNGDFPAQTESYEYFRFNYYNSPNNPNGAYLQIGEIEIFGTADGGVLPLYVGGQNTIGQETINGLVGNKVYSATDLGGTGWNIKMVDSTTTIDSHSVAELVLDTDDGDVSNDIYAGVDVGGGDGTFLETEAYPNGIGPGDTSVEDFALRASAKVVIPVGTYTIGFGSDDGGQITIPGVTFTDSLSNDSTSADQIRYEGNRGHAWTVGTFEVTGEPLETTIMASMHERGGGDSFEVAIIDGEAVEAASPDLGWEILADGTFGWSVSPTDVTLASGEINAETRATPQTWQFDVNGDNDSADQFVVPNSNPDVYTSILNIDGVKIEIKATGAVANGDAFKIIDADQIVGTPVISSAVAGQTWVFDAATGNVCLGSCPGGVAGDYNGDGQVDAADIDAQAVAMLTPTQNLGTFDENGDGTI
ncbi:MAG: hypothetical protein KDB23_20910, partial [Planctomycetales bacterium]|nr:hypothetical protein [Planctomycetales bacterium]